MLVTYANWKDDVIKFLEFFQHQINIAFNEHHPLKLTSIITVIVCDIYEYKHVVSNNKYSFYRTQGKLLHISYDVYDRQIKPYFQKFLKTLNINVDYFEERDLGEWTLIPETNLIVTYKTAPLQIPPLIYDFTKLLESKLFTDFIIVYNGQRILAPRAVLYQNRGRYFKTLTIFILQRTTNTIHCSREIFNRNFYLRFVYADLNATLLEEMDLIQAYIFGHYSQNLRFVAHISNLNITKDLVPYLKGLNHVYLDPYIENIVNAVENEQVN